MKLRLAAVIMFLGIALGAFGAHGFEDLLEKNDRVATWDTAVLYHLVHGVALVLIALLLPQRNAAYWALVIGIAVFSGSLYTLSLTNITKFGAITPIGGLSFLVGWITIVFQGDRGGVAPLAK